MSDEAESGPGRGRIVGAVVGGAAVAALLLVLLVGLLNQDRSTVIADALNAGERPAAPELELPVLIGGGGLTEGETVRLSELRGRPILLNFWASWCDPCSAEAPVLEHIWQTYRDQGLLVLGVDARDLSDNARAFDDQHGLTYPSLRDGDDSSERAYETVGVPETFLIDAEGRITAKVVGPILSPDQVTGAIEEVL